MSGDRVLVWDASALHHAAKADRIDVLADLAAPFRNVTTAAVLDELDEFGLRSEASAGGWLEEPRLDGLTEIGLLGTWLERLGAGRHHRGEVTVAVACEVLGATALLDDRDATRVMLANGLACHGTIWLAHDAVQSGRFTSAAFDGFFGVRLEHGARFPFRSGPEWGPWARRYLTARLSRSTQAPPAAREPLSDPSAARAPARAATASRCGAPARRRRSRAAARR